MNKNNPLVSVVIVTKNEAKHIYNCLNSIKLQTYPHIEIIVVDNNSTDETKKISREFSQNVFNIGPERSKQRNYGIDKAKGKYVMFIDADMILDPHVIDSSVEEMEKGKIVALHIPEIVLGKKYFSRVRRFERTFYNGTAIDGARFFDRETFVKVGGFDEKLCGPEDWDIDKKIKKIGKIGLLQSDSYYQDWPMEKMIIERGVNPKKYSAVIYHNEAEFDLKKYLNKKGYYSKSFDDYVKKWGENDPDIKKQLGFYYRFIGVFTEKNNWQKLLYNPFDTFGMYFLRFLVGVVYLTRKRT
jgi:glycosyltransferase involved in cell wall biosynthesis